MWKYLLWGQVLTVSSALRSCQIIYLFPFLVLGGVRGLSFRIKTLPKFMFVNFVNKQVNFYNVAQQCCESIPDICCHLLVIVCTCLNEFNVGLIIFKTKKDIIDKNKTRRKDEPLFLWNKQNEQFMSRSFLFLYKLFYFTFLVFRIVKCTNNFERSFFNFIGAKILAKIKHLFRWQKVSACALLTSLG